MKTVYQGDRASQVRAADQAQADIFARLATQSSGGTARQAEYGALFSTRIPSRNLNGLFLTEEPRDRAQTVKETLEFLRQTGSSGSITGRDALIDSIRSELSTQGFEEFDSDVGMILESLDHETNALPPGLVIERITDLDGVKDCFLTIAKGYGIPSFAFFPLLNTKRTDAYFADPPMMFFLGYVDGVPAAASVGIAWEGVSYVFIVATVPKYRRRGIGMAMTWRVIDECRASGCNVSFLRATEMGRPVYEKMGYREVNRYPSLGRPMPSFWRKARIMLRLISWKIRLRLAGPSLRDKKNA